MAHAYRVGVVAAVDDVVDAPATRSASRWWTTVVLAVGVVSAVLGVARWTGQAPFGSDNDEYQLVARQLVELSGPVVAGVEGTKYPLGYPAVLAVLDGVGLPVVDGALVFNVLLVAVGVALTALAARHLGAVAAVVAAGVVLVDRPLWDATQSTMPDVAFLVVVAGALAANRRPAALTLLAVAAASLRSVGVLVGLAATASLLWQLSPASRRSAAKERGWALAPAAAALAVTAAMAAIAERHPEHTTGYSRTFWLEDPYDAASGDASVLDVVGRIGSRMDLVLDDATRALWGDLVHGPPGWLLTAALVAVGVASVRNRVFAGAFVVLDLLLLAVWPYSSVRFGLPLVPIAAVGVGAVAARLRVPVVAAAAGVAAVIAVAVPAFRDEADRQGDLYAELHDTRADVATWLEGNGASTPVSADYRELALELDRPVLPITYTSDTDVLLTEATTGTHLVVLRGLYGQRDELYARLLTAFPERFELVHANDRWDVYRVLPS